MKVDGKNISDTDRLKMLVLDELEGERSPPKAIDESGITKFEQIRDDGLYNQVLRLTPAMWRELSPARRRLMLDFTVRRVEQWEEKIAFMSRNLAVGELSLPDYLREKGAA